MADDLAVRLDALSPPKRALIVERLTEMERGSGPPERSGSSRESVGPEPAAGSDARLVAYVVPSEGAALDVEALREFVAAELPEHQVPSVFVALDELPRGPTGKVDRAALPHPDRDRLQPQSDFVEPQSSDEIRLARIWSEVLGVDLVGLDDNFLEIGGHSLLAIRLLGRIREAFGVELPMGVLFEAPTVRGTLRSIDTLRWVKDGPRTGDSDGQESFEL